MELSTEEKLLIWIDLNCGRNTNYGDEFKSIAAEFKKATEGDHKFCKCNPDRGKVVNQIWDDWHCPYCLKPK